MRVTKPVRVRVRKHKLVDIQCNRCGASCRLEDEGNFGGGRVTAHGCYGSTIPQDLTRWSLHLCQHCLGWLVSTCKIPPTVRGYEAECDVIVPALMEGKLEPLSEESSRHVLWALGKGDAGRYPKEHMSYEEHRYLWCLENLATCKGVYRDAAETYLQANGWVQFEDGMWKSDSGDYHVVSSLAFAEGNGYTTVSIVARHEGRHPAKVYEAMLGNYLSEALPF